MPSVLLIFLLAAAPSLSAAELTWTQADYKARKLFLTARLSVKLEQDKPATMTADWPPAFQGEALAPVGETLSLITLRSELAGSAKETRLYMDPINGAALRREKRDLSSTPDFKDLRFTHTGIARLRAEPLDGQENLDPSSWGQVRRRFRAYPETAAPVTISDSAALPVLVSRHDWSGPGESLEVFIFEDDNIVRITATSRRWLKKEVDYRTSAGKRGGKAKLLEISLKPTLYGKSTDADIDLFGLSGDVHMLIDTDRHLPIEILGSVDYFGDVRFALKRIREEPEKS
ncbi:MAG: hypothetical protein ACR2QB_10505 [Gammaproteobacteria bacterium]